LRAQPTRPFRNFCVLNFLDSGARSMPYERGDPSGSRPVVGEMTGKGSDGPLGPSTVTPQNNER